MSFARWMTEEKPSSLPLGLELALQPNYLGSPKVVSGILQTVIVAALAFVKRETSFDSVWNTVWDL
ncbi:hypothetical protein LAZ40_12690 [Cereibacter sphaeroides]|uniref:hypothetical protein n=1 Tax=Cereibacter sphaeroides TaxID=1063 RepID=UPI001F41C68F|nr:hypothetical protein [Cereibacter sphaeroides]MCE6959881.1 hypothetical protein [Cereibacter sphaeroides]MCE6968652.1 hypothetical protein [Cereibacter sphaeroides]MCE6974735.1 hypothetical protein [Cereibacter sphaeroides]